MALRDFALILVFTWQLHSKRKPETTLMISGYCIDMAEREGFEPSVHLYSVHSLSRRAPSADSAISPCSFQIVAEGVGFEPTVPLLTEQRFSRPPP